MQQTVTPDMPMGYLSPAYGQSFAAAGPIVTLPKSGLQLIQRHIRGGQSDLIGLYPYSMARDFSTLAGAADRAALRATGAVALSFVADPFAAEAVRAACAPWALCRPFKTHFAIDLDSDWRAARSKNTRYYVRKGYERQRAETVTPDASHAATFWRLYRFTIGRHRLSGIQRLSEAALAAQMQVPGAFLTLTRKGGTLTGAMLSYAHASHATAHLVSFDAAHYGDHTSSVLIDAAATHAEALGCRWYNLGGAAGAMDDPEDGLYRFKSRWTPHRRTAWLCGDILDRAAYAALCAEAGAGPDEAFFPAYRRPGGPFEWRPEL